MLKIVAIFLSLFVSFNGFSTQILIPMDDTQSNHLKAYGLAFWSLENNVTLEWLLNYRGGSFLLPHMRAIEEELLVRNVKYEVLADGQVNQIRSQISNPEVNMEIGKGTKDCSLYTPWKTTLG